MTLQQLNYAIVIAEKGSMNEAARKLYISQPTLSESIRELETEIGIQLFIRSNRGVIVTPEGEEFLASARQITSQFKNFEEQYLEKKKKRVFSVSMQHYTFAVKAFIDTVKSFGIDSFDFSVQETTTYDVIMNVKNLRSELGVIYLNEFNERGLLKMLSQNGLEFIPLFTCDTYVYLWSGHPLAKQKSISLSELEEYPCLSFDQGRNATPFLAEEMMSEIEHSRLIHANDRATLLNLMHGLNAYTLCSGIICEDLNGDDYLAIPLVETEPMTIGYIKRQRVKLSRIGQVYVDALKEYEKNVISNQ
ncbi:MAG: LysR family transcriptional regulator [Dorea sp.]|nr:LysR family transcriptional regulator [Dorea sp.]